MEVFVKPLTEGLYLPEVKMLERCTSNRHVYCTSKFWGHRRPCLMSARSFTQRFVFNVSHKYKSTGSGLANVVAQSVASYCVAKICFNNAWIIFSGVGDVSRCCVLLGKIHSLS